MEDNKLDYLKERQNLVNEILASAENNQPVMWQKPYVNGYPKNFYAKEEDSYNGFNMFYLLRRQQKREEEGIPTGYQYIAEKQFEKNKKISLKENAKPYKIEFWGQSTPMNSFYIKEEKDIFIVLDKDYKKVFINKEKEVVFDYIVKQKGFVYRNNEEFLSYLKDIGLNDYEFKNKKIGKPFCKNYIVYNEADVEGLESKPFKVKTDDESENEKIAYFMEKGIKIIYSNHLNVTEDGIYMPKPESFTDWNSCYSTYFYLQQLQKLNSALDKEDKFYDILVIRNQILSQMTSLLVSAELKQGYNPEEFANNNLIALLKEKLNSIDSKEFEEKFGTLDNFLLRSISSANTLARKLVLEINEKFKEQDKNKEVKTKKTLFKIKNN